MDFTNAMQEPEVQSKYLSLKTKIITTKLNETKVFYQRLFNMVVIDEWNSSDDKGVILSFDKDRHEALLEIYHDDERRDHSGVSLQFRSSDIGQFVADLPPDIAYEGPKERPWGSKYVYIRDPNDILLIVYEGGW
jgi:catechol 2,3-dioxygenase-like lactoylglutathione lyase family enzyme